MKNRIIEIIKGFDEIADWSISKTTIKKNELYLIFDKTEAERIVESHDYTVAIYIDKEENGKKMRGMSYQTFSADLPDSEIKKLISNAVFAASLALNPHYELAENEDNDTEYQACDEDFYNNPNETIIKMKNEIYEAIAKESDIRMSSGEIFVTCSENEFYTSRGVHNSSKKTRIMFELVLLAGEGENEVESSIIRDERYLDILDIKNIIKEYAAHARNSLIAKLPKSGKFDVIFTGEALEEFFDYYISQSSGSSAYYQTAKFKLDEPVVVDVKGDKITMFSDPTLKGGIRTDKYDTYGTLLKKFPVIKNGKLINICADNQYATYLNIDTKGSLTNLNVSAGTKTYNQLLTDNTFVLSRFSTFSPNAVTGAFSGEIRSGFQKIGDKEIQVKGGSVTGLMDSAMQEVYFSKEIVQVGKYKGPKYIKVCNLDIAGE